MGGRTRSHWVATSNSTPYFCVYANLEVCFQISKKFSSFQFVVRDFRSNRFFRYFHTISFGAGNDVYLYGTAYTFSETGLHAQKVVKVPELRVASGRDRDLTGTEADFDTWLVPIILSYL